MDRAENGNPDDVMLKAKAPAAERDMMSAGELSPEEIAAIRDASSRFRISRPKVEPYFSIKEISQKGRRKMVPFIGVKVNF